MEKKSEEKLTEDWLQDVTRELAVKSFKTDEMIDCPQCARRSPPTRLNCMYCGTELPVTADHAEFFQPTVRKIELWEKAFNLILLPEKSRFDDEKCGRIARLFNLTNDDLQKILAARVPVPLIRLENLREAEVLRDGLAKIDVAAAIAADEDLHSETFPRRLRRIEFEDDKVILILFNADEIVEIAPDDMALIVFGATFERKVESSAKRKKGVNKITDSVDTSEDEFVLDIYTRADEIGWRVTTSGFDFSVLGGDKQFFARDNIKILAEKLRRFAPEAKFSDGYRSLRDVLGKIWELEERKDSRGFQKKSFGGFSLESAVLTNNSVQMLKFSRLERLFYEEI